VDAASIVVATLYTLAERKQIEMSVVTRAIKEVGMDPEKVYPQLV
jgi:pyruvate dehydrogenase complex dehydrogenase (E1) component